MRRLIHLRFGGRDVHVPKLIGVFILVFAVLMVIKSAAIMLDSWDALQNFDNCSDVDAGACGEALYRITGVSIWAGQTELNTTTFWAALTGPTAVLFFWLIVLLVGMVFYKSGNLILPIEESMTDLPPVRRKR